MKTKDIKKQLKKKKKIKLTKADFLSTGSTLLNLAISGKPDCGFIKGKYFWLVGDSTSGKTFLSLTCLAEASINPNFDDYDFIHDDVEGGSLMDIKRFFGEKVAKRIRPPQRAYAQSGFESPIYSSTIEDFYFNLDDAFERGKPFIYILDSMDSLSSEYEKKKFKAGKNATRKGKKTTGSFGDGKAKKNSENVRQLLSPLKKSGSILIIISQTRANFDFGFEKKTHAGGHSLKFYACVELWSSVRGKIEKTIKKKSRQIGNICKIRTKKNRVSGRDRAVEVPIYHSFGIDETGSCIDYLIDELHWKMIGKTKIKAKEFGVVLTRAKLIKHIEDNGMIKDLREIVGDVWNEIEEACSIKRKQRY